MIKERPQDTQFPLLMNRQQVSLYIGISDVTFDKEFRYTEEFKKSALRKVGTEERWYRPEVDRILKG